VRKWQVVQEASDEPLYIQRVCAIDVAKGRLDACIRLPSDRDPKRRSQEVGTFATIK